MKWGASLILPIILFMSCGTLHTVYDDSVHIKNSAIIRMHDTLNYIGFDGNTVDWSNGFWGGKSVQIPHGEHELVVAVNNVHYGNFIYHGGQFYFTYKFKRGHRYNIYVDRFELASLYVMVHDLTTNRKTSVRAVNGVIRHLDQLMGI
jgi:hypothetical protein